MWIPRDLIMMGIGAIILVVLVGFYEILFDYSGMKKQEQEEQQKPKHKCWIKRGWHNMIRDIKTKFKKKDQVVKPKKKLTKKQAQAKLKKMFK